MGLFSVTCFIRVESGTYQGGENTTNTGKSQAASSASSWAPTPRAPKKRGIPTNGNNGKIIQNAGKKKERRGETGYMLLLIAAILKIGRFKVRFRVAKAK